MYLCQCDSSCTEAGQVRTWKISSQTLAGHDFNIERTERGIIYVVEIDKIAKKSENVSITRDVSVKGTTSSSQDYWGTVASVPPQGGHKHPQLRDDSGRYKTSSSSWVVLLLSKSLNNVWVKKSSVSGPK